MSETAPRTRELIRDISPQDIEGKAYKNNREAAIVIQTRLTYEKSRIEESGAVVIRTAIFSYESGVFAHFEVTDAPDGAT